MHNPTTSAASLGWRAIGATEIKGNGIQAPGHVVLSYTGRQPHPFVVHFFNGQDGCFYFGDYCADHVAAAQAYEAKLARYARHLANRT